MKYAYILALLLVAACAGNPEGPRFDANNITPSRGPIVVIYRPVRSYFDQGMSDVAISGGSKCNLRNAGYTYAQVPEGKHEITATSWDQPGTSRKILPINGAKIYYIRLDANRERFAAATAGGLIGQVIDEAAATTRGPFILTVVDPEQARDELKGSKQDCI